jgi:MerR family transcriptional regulator/heat shock protein HspR
MPPHEKPSGSAYRISAVAERYGLHPQTLRLYEREGLLAPSRSKGNTRLYTERDLRRLEVILHLTRELGVNLAGVEVILHMRSRLESLQGDLRQVADFLQAELHRQARETGDTRLMPVTHRQLLQSLRRLSSAR